MEQEGSLVVLTGAAAIIAYILKKKSHRRVRRRRWWSTDIFLQRREQELLQILKNQELSGQYKNFTRMSSRSFEELFQMIAPVIVKKHTNMREPISAQDRLAVTLRFLASGDSYSSLQYTFKISKQSISCIIPEVCSALLEALKDYVKLPSNPEEWKEVSKLFQEKWNLPHCVGAIDGKHIVLQAPIHSGSEFFNYKSTFSIVLFALVDGDNNFLYADVGCQGRISDGGIFNDSQLKKRIVDGTHGLPEPVELSGREENPLSRKIPFFIAGDSAFPLMENIMKPYPGINEKGSIERVFNYRLSRGRRIVENVFGISSSVFRILRRIMLLQPETAQLVVMVIVHLHNYLRKHAKNEYTPPDSLDLEDDGIVHEGSWRRDPDSSTSFVPVRGIPIRSSNDSQKNRDELANYFMNEGAVPWQLNYA